MQGELFKVGLLVLDLAKAMDDIGGWLGVDWTAIADSPLELETSEGRESVGLRYVYSTKGPVFLELIEATGTGYYAPSQGPHLHHVGRWVSDLSAASARLEREGLALEAAGVGEDGQSPALFAFHRGDHGMRVELVDEAMRSSFETWLAGGDLELR